MIGDFGYNPCDDGLAAKVWECLRRNVEFSRCVADAQAVAQSDQWLTWEGIHENVQDNPFAGAALRFLLPVSPEGAAESPAVRLSQTWPQTADDFQEAFRATMAMHVGHAELVAPPPDVNPLDPSLSAEDRASFAKWWLMIRSTSSTHDLLASPKFVLNKRDSKRVATELEKLVRETSIDVRSTYPQGRLLGSLGDWESFLMSEHYVKATRSAAWGRAVACWSKYGEGKDKPEEVRLSEECRTEADHFTSGQKGAPGSEFDKQVARVKDAISRTFPVFDAFLPQ